MIRARCLDCGGIFERDPDMTWKKRCIPCYVKLKAAQSAPPAVDAAYAEFIGNLKPLIQLTHPDRHNNSLLANRISSWLLSVKTRVAERAQ
jgi:hypothetical protein